MPVVKRSKAKSAVRSKALSNKSPKLFWKTPVGVAIIITLLVAALVFITGKTQEDRSAVETMSSMEYPAEQLMNTEKNATDEGHPEEGSDVTEMQSEQPSDSTAY